MKFMFYYANRLNNIFATALKKKKKNSTTGATSLYINIFTKTNPVPATVLAFLKTNVFFKKTVANYFITKKIFFKNKKKTPKTFFFLKKKRPIKNNYFQNKKSYNFVFIKFLNENNFLNKKTDFNSSFFFYLINFKFFTNELSNYLKLILNDADSKKIVCFFYLKILKQFNKDQVNSIYFYNITKHADFWQLISKFFFISDSKLKVIPSYLTTLCMYEKTQETNFNLELPKLKVLKNSLDQKIASSFFFKNKEFVDSNFENLKLNFNFFFFFRKNNLYNKGKFSRNRQTYRTGVFLCIWLTVLTVIGMYFYFLMLSIKFTYLIFFFIFFIFLFFYKYWFFTVEKKIENHSWLFFF